MIDQDRYKSPQIPLGTPKSVRRGIRQQSHKVAGFANHHRRPLRQHFIPCLNSVLSSFFLASETCEPSRVGKSASRSFISRLSPDRPVIAHGGSVEVAAIAITCSRNRGWTASGLTNRRSPKS